MYKCTIVLDNIPHMYIKCLMKIFFQQIDLFDILLFLGCILIGYGLFLLNGLGFSLTVVGAIFLFIGLLGSIPALFKGKVK